MNGTDETQEMLVRTELNVRQPVQHWVVENKQLCLSRMLCSLSAGEQMEVFCLLLNQLC